MQNLYACKVSSIISHKNKSGIEEETTYVSKSWEVVTGGG
jgi:hypothetical protein